MKTTIPAKKPSGAKRSGGNASDERPPLAADDAGLEARRAKLIERKAGGDLSLYDEAMEVAEDVARYGFQGAVAIHGQSEAWVSKRAQVVKYDKAVLDLLQQGLCADLEALLSLNQLLGLDQRAFDAFAARLREGKPVSRAEVRSKVAAAKVWTRPGKLGMLAGAEGSGESPVSERMAAERLLLRKRSELMEWGVANGLQIDDLGRTVHGLQLDQAEGEWVFWTGFLDSVLPMLRALGSERARAYLQRVQLELGTRDAAAWWDSLHPVAGSPSEAGAETAQATVAKMPPGWRF